MIHDFRRYIEKTLKVPFRSKVILAVSGGIDSMVMLYLAKEVFYDIVAAHCNFQLRGSESDKDEEFVKLVASDLEIPFYSEKFNTTKYAVDHRISIQVAARDLRYSWFEKLRAELNYDYIAIGHNKNDVTETFIHNLLRGSGIKGLAGISPKVNSIIRPLLFASRDDILKFSQKNDIRYREDSTNHVSKYTRNKIRHMILPLFRELNQNYEDHIHHTINFFEDVKQMLEEKVDSYQEKIFEKESGHIININELEKIPYFPTLLFFILNKFGFNSSTVKDIIGSLHEESGKVFYSDSHMLLKDREHIIVRPKIINEEIEIQFEDSESALFEPFHLEMKKFDRTERYIIPTSKKIAALDYNSLQFPLKIRKWKKGDRFIPLGMIKFKKLSDFFIDEKISIFAKEDQYILTNHDDNIIWIINHRIDDRYKITRNTKTIYQLELLP